MASPKPHVDVVIDYDPHRHLVAEPRRCAISMILKESDDDITYVHTTYEYIHIHRRSTRQKIIYATPMAAKRWLQRFDHPELKLKIKPFRLVLTDDDVAWIEKIQIHTPRSFSHRGTTRNKRAAGPALELRYTPPPKSKAA